MKNCLGEVQMKVKESFLIAVWTRNHEKGRMIL